MPRLSSCLFGALVAVCLAPRGAAAQVNTDVGLSAGAVKRFATGASLGVSDPGFGPMAQLQAHLAIFPMVRAGLYASWDYSPMPGAGTRNFYEGGLHFRFTPPLLPTPWKAYLFTGIGAAYVHVDSYASALGTNMAGLPPSTQVRWQSLDGGLFELPLGLGLARKLGARWEVFAELGGRFGLGFFGRAYDAANTASGSPIANAPLPAANFTGVDSFALTLCAGVSWSD